MIPALDHASVDRLAQRLHFSMHYRLDEKVQLGEWRHMQSAAELIDKYHDVAPGVIIAFQRLPDDEYLTFTVYTSGSETDAYATRTELEKTFRGDGHNAHAEYIPVSETHLDHVKSVFYQPGAVLNLLFIGNYYAGSRAMKLFQYDIG